jgi:transcriptional regulator GlxA family with amidase domain
MKNTGILIFNNIDLLDIAGPYEVFSLARTADNESLFNLFPVAQTKEVVATWKGFSIIPKYDFNDCPDMDILLVPGGLGTRTEINNDKLVRFIKTVFPHVELVLSVCTGALLLAKAGLLKGLKVATHHAAVDLLRKTEPAVIMAEKERYTDNGKIILSAGISAGIDMAFYTIKRLYGQEMAEQIAGHMEYDMQRDI